MDSSTIASCLGLDPSKFASSIPVQDLSYYSYSLKNDKAKYETCRPLIVSCQCKTVKSQSSFSLLTFSQPVEIEGIYHAEFAAEPNKSITCPNCNKQLSRARIQNAADLLIRQCLASYYSQMMVCDDATCGLNTARALVKNNMLRCVRPGCRGNLLVHYSEKKLHLQLQYLASLFDTEHLGDCVKTWSFNGEFVKLANYLSKKLNFNGRNWVNLGSLFSFATPPVAVA